MAMALALLLAEILEAWGAGGGAQGEGQNGRMDPMGFLIQ